MDAPAFMRFITSPLFTIIVEGDAEDPKKFFIHSALLASMSPSISLLVNGNMKEALEKCVVWDLDERTVAFFCEFAYTGDYSISAESEMNFHFCGQNLIRAIQGHDSGADDGNKDISNDNTTETYKAFIADECLAHARLMIFADYHGVDKLLNLAKVNLTAHLEKIAPYSHDVVAELLRQTDDFPDCLHHVVADHVLFNFRSLWAHIPLREAMEKRPRLMTEVLNRLASRW